MLVISRKAGESILILDKIKISVISISGDKVTIGIEAPKDVNILREELVETIEANKASEKSGCKDQYLSLVNLIKDSKSKT